MSQINKPQKSLFSVIIPLYNKAPYIKRAIDSVLAQTIQDFEIIVVNDGSTDGGENIVAEYSDSRIFLINQKNTGVSVARNNGVNVANSELISFLDADDIWYPEYLETIFGLYNKYPNSGLYGTGYEMISNKTGAVRKYTYELFDAKYFEIQNYHEVINKNLSGWMLIMTSSMTIPKSILLEVGGFPSNYHQHEDRCLRAKIALKYPVAYSPRVSARYYHDIRTYEGRSSKYLVDPFTDYLENNPDALHGRDDADDVIEFSDMAKLGMAMMNLKSGQNRKKIRQSVKSVKTSALFLKKNLIYVATYVPGFIIEKMIGLYWYRKYSW